VLTSSKRRHVAATVLAVLVAGCARGNSVDAQRTEAGIVFERADYGFWDPGLVQATARTAYDAPDEGTATNRLTPAPCLYPDASDPILINSQACARVAALPPFASGNGWTNAAAWPTESFWVV